MAGYDPLPGQSPIDLGKALPIDYKFPPDHVRLNWTHPEKGKPNEEGPHGREIEFKDSKNTIFVKLPGHQHQTEFTLAKLHFHAPGEHRMNDVQSTLELHIVHAAEEEDPLNPGEYRKIYAVLGIMVEPKTEKLVETAASRDTDVFRKIREKFEEVEETKGDCEPDFDFDPYELLPFEAQTPMIEAAFWRYEGSLTSDRFDANVGHVSWFVLKVPREIKEPDLSQWVGTLKHKAKLSQPLDRRFVFFHPGGPPDSPGEIA